MLMFFSGKVEVIDYTKSVIRSENFSVFCPKTIRLLNFNRVFFGRGKTKFNRNNVYRRDKYICQYCGRNPRKEELTLDHVIPKSMGGQTDWGNVVTCCYECNQKKGRKTPHQAGMRLKSAPITP